MTIIEPNAQKLDEIDKKLDQEIKKLDEQPLPPTADDKLASDTPSYSDGNNQSDGEGLVRQPHGGRPGWGPNPRPPRRTMLSWR
jgi:hypothetical protein